MGATNFILTRSNNITAIREDENALFAELERNVADEAEARQGYYILLTKFGYLLNEKETEDFREIIAEESKHTNLLNDMIQRRNGIIAER